MTVSDLSELKQLSGKPTEAWIQHSISLLDRATGGDLLEAKLCLETQSRSEENFFPISLLLVRTCLQLDGYESCAEAVSVARYAMNICSAENLPEASLAVVVALGQQSRQAGVVEEQKQALRAEAFKVLTAALCPSGTVLHVLLQYNWALLLAESGQSDAATAKARSALEATFCMQPIPSSAPVATVALSPSAQDATNACLLLLSLLMSARQQPGAALKVLAATQAGSKPSGSAASTSKQSLLKYEVLVGRLRSRLQFAQGSHSAAVASLVALKKQLASKYASQPIERGLAEALAEAEACIWTDLSTLFVAQSQFHDAMFCVEHAQKVQPWQPNTFHAIGMVQEAAGQLDDAVETYNAAIAIDPRHAPSLLRLGTVARRRGSGSDLALARKLLLDAMRFDPSAPGNRYQLGLVAKALGHREESESHMFMAVKLAMSTPALPYSSLPLLMA